MFYFGQVSIVMEQMMRLLHYCGLPVEDVDFINSDGKTMNKILLEVRVPETHKSIVCLHFFLKLS